LFNEFLYLARDHDLDEDLDDKDFTEVDLGDFLKGLFFLIIV